MSTSLIDRIVVYLAAPYTSNPVPNTHAVIKIAERLQSTGLVTAYVPHLNLLWDIVIPHSADEWLEYDLCFLRRSDALLRIPGISPGADGEEAFAKDHDIPVFYTEDGLLSWASDQYGE